MASYQIFHLADIHFKDTRRQEYSEILSKLYLSIKQHQKLDKEHTLICILGDIFDTQTRASGYNIQDVSNMFVELSKFGSVIIIPGNHDFSVRNVERYLDLITPIIDILKLTHPNIYYYSESGMNRFNPNITFTILSPKDTFKDNIEPYIPCDNFHICLLHDEIKAPNFHLSEPHIPIEKIKGYDLVLCGHIHKRVFLSEKIAYSGSLIQQDLGEDPTEHGYIIWNIDTRMKQVSYELINIPNDYGYLKLSMKDNQLLTRNVFKRLHKFTVSFENCSPEEVNEVIRTYNKISEIKTKPIPEITMTRISEQPRTISFEELVLSKIKDTSSSEKVLKLHNEFRREVITETNHGLWTPTKLELSGFLYHKDEKVINFQNMLGKIGGIIGKNHTGKTTILNALMLVAYSNMNGINKKDIINHDSNESRIKLEFECDGKKGMIERKDRNSKKSNVSFVFDDKNLGNKIKDTYSEIGSYLGSYEMASNMNFIVQGSYQLVATMSQLDLKRFLISLFNLEEFQMILKRAKSEALDIQKEIKGYKTGIQCENDMTLKEFRHETKKDIKRNRKLVEKYENVVRDMKEKLEMIKFKDGISVSETKIDELFETLRDLYEKYPHCLDNLHLGRDKLLKINEFYSKNQSEIDKITETLPELREKYEQTIKQIKKLTPISLDEYKRCVRFVENYGKMDESKVRHVVRPEKLYDSPRESEISDWKFDKNEFNYDEKLEKRLLNELEEYKNEYRLIENDALPDDNWNNEMISRLRMISERLRELGTRQKMNVSEQQYKESLRFIDETNVIDVSRDKYKFSRDTKFSLNEFKSERCREIDDVRGLVCEKFGEYEGEIELHDVKYDRNKERILVGQIRTGVESEETLEKMRVIDRKIPDVMFEKECGLYFDIKQICEEIKNLGIIEKYDEVKQDEYERARKFLKETSGIDVSKDKFKFGDKIEFRLDEFISERCREMRDDEQWMKCWNGCWIDGMNDDETEGWSEDWSEVDLRVGKIVDRKIPEVICEDKRELVERIREHLNDVDAEDVRAKVRMKKMLGDVKFNKDCPTCKMIRKLLKVEENDDLVDVQKLIEEYNSHVDKKVRGYLRMIYKQNGMYNDLKEKVGLNVSMVRNYEMMMRGRRLEGYEKKLDSKISEYNKRIDEELFKSKRQKEIQNELKENNKDKDEYQKMCNYLWYVSESNGMYNDLKEMSKKVRENVRDYEIGELVREKERLVDEYNKKVVGWREKKKELEKVVSDKDEKMRYDLMRNYVWYVSEVNRMKDDMNDYLKLKEKDEIKRKIDVIEGMVKDSLVCVRMLEIGGELSLKCNEKIEKDTKKMSECEKECERLEEIMSGIDEMIEKEERLELVKEYIKLINPRDEDEVILDMLKEKSQGLIVRINEILGETNETMRVSIDDDYNIYVDGILARYSSGSQKFIFELCLRLAMIEIGSRNCMNGIIIDEGFGMLDSENLEGIKRMLVKLKKAGRLIVIITHVEEMKDIMETVEETS
ncbi:3',5'-cyclic adenosine monophosphate phosphodiesterase CpdA [uncultured archaeon]|nr:3',5'-cyclic adenosine monophosphate phosphodiesterase CpdA [uncultured archaeon]